MTAPLTPPEPPPQPSDPAAPDASLGQAQPQTQTNVAASGAPSNSGAATPRREVGAWLWAVGIITLFCAELYIYGHNGRVQVCVGLEGMVDFGLIGTVRTPENVQKFPFCSERLNLGMYGNSEEAAKVSLTEACIRGSGLLGGDRLECLRRENGWTRRVLREQIAPWDPRLYRRLLWLD